MKNWKTTLGGLLLTVGTALTQTDDQWMSLAGTVMVGLSGLLIAQARDNNVSSEGNKIG